LQFKLGAHSVINGLETAVLQHMRQPGDLLTVLMPSGTAYGSLGAGDGIVPPYEDLTFEIELVEVTRAAVSMAVRAKRGAYAGP
jgi:FKBP-type peptidyl-prolyl cis-trans isomerase